MTIITKQYCQPAVEEQVRVAYNDAEPPSVQLQQFLEQSVRVDLYKALEHVQWTREVIADRYARRVAPVPKELATVLETVQAYITRICGVHLGTVRFERYAHRDYTLRNDEEKPPGIIAYLDLTLDWPADAGGELIIADESGDSLSIEPLENTLVIADCSERYPFVRYVNADAGDEVITRLVFSR